MNFQTDVLSDENNYLFKQEKILPALNMINGIGPNFNDFQSLS